MAKNISKNQWFKKIADNVYLYTTVINDMLLVQVIPNGTFTSTVNVGTLRNPSVVNFGTLELLKSFNYQIWLLKNGELHCNFINISTKDNPYVIFIPLKSKQLETDFYTTEQLAEMYPDDPAYQVATADLPKDDNATQTDIDSHLSKVIPINEP